MSESKLQTAVLAWLKANNFWVFKTIVCNRKGIMDIVGCSPVLGMFIGIELKWGTNKPSKLQSYNIEEVQKRHGVAFAAWSLEEVKQGLKLLMDTEQKLLQLSDKE